MKWACHLFQICLATTFETTTNEPPKYPREPLMYPSRLATTRSGKIRLYAYPSQWPADTLLQLQTETPVIADYVLGPAWQQQLDDHGRMYVPQDNWTYVDETEIALRILKVGGAIMDTFWSNNMPWNYGSGFSGWSEAQSMQQYVFGWPSEGGVWVLHLPPFRWLELNPDEALARDFSEIERRKDINRPVARYRAGGIDFGNLTKSRSMDEFCTYLKTHRANSPPNITESSEVHEAGLLDYSALTREPPRSAWYKKCHDKGPK